MSEPIKIERFEGMDNVDPLRDLASPHVVHNLDVTKQGSLKRRDGYTKLATLVDSHSLFSVDNFLYCVAVGSSYSFALWQLSQTGTAIEVCEVTGNNPVYALRVENVVYLASISWTKVLDIATATVRAWGVPVPTVAPAVTVS